MGKKHGIGQFFIPSKNDKKKPFYYEIWEMGDL